MNPENSFSLSEGIIEIEEAGVSQENGKSCLNCQTVLSGPYCFQCGQKDIPRRQTIGDLFINFVSSFWSFESKVLKTGRYLFSRPGFLPLEYNKGKRESYFHPARMYVFASFIYFLLINLLPDPATDKSYTKDYFTRDYSGVSDSTNTKGRLNWTYGGEDIQEYKTFWEYDSAQQALPEAKRDGFLKHFAKKRGYAIREHYGDSKAGFSSAFSQAFVDNSSKIFFFLLPIFALILKMLYVRRNVFYSEHLVFSVYYYNFFFLAGSLYMLFEFVPVLKNFTWALVIWIILYLLFAMKRMYSQSWRKTFLKFSIFTMTFSFCVLIGLAINAIAIFLIL